MPGKQEFSGHRKEFYDSFRLENRQKADGGASEEEIAVSTTQKKIAEYMLNSAIKMKIRN
jgi:hypothetical protein